MLTPSRDLTKDLLFGSEKLKDDKNNALLTSTIEIRLDWHLLYKPFSGHFWTVIKVIDYGITPSISHLHIFIFVLAIK